MTEIEKMNESEELLHNSNTRRAFLGRVAVAGLGVAALGLVAPSEVVAATQPKQPEADTGHDYPMAKPHAMTEAQFRKGVIGPAMLSLLTSQIAVDKATNPQALEFANFELREAIGVTTVLKSLKTPVPPMSPVAKAILEKIKSTPKGADFDKAYITAQLANHEFLRDLANSYLANSAGHTSMAEMHGRHLATLTLGVFKEHIVHTKNILHMMSA
ncbi:hypothetical protein IAD21_03753 [Abditibacteriota bacterium]|nr:hypothetical protein IAD21_03753 [Abditibacteriota bacterium]